VWLEGGWYVFDPHMAIARKGRVFIASGLDAADAAFATLYGGARLVKLDVWADAVDEHDRKLNLALPRIPAPLTAAAAQDAPADAAEAMPAVAYG
jgi:hypothetical protein